MLVFQINPVEVELFSYANAFFCSNKCVQMLATSVKTLYSSSATIFISFSCTLMLVCYTDVFSVVTQRSSPLGRSLA